VQPIGPNHDHQAHELPSHQSQHGIVTVLGLYGVADAAQRGGGGGAVVCDVVDDEDP
jgi:hypothetical protein